MKYVGLYIFMLRTAHKEGQWYEVAGDTQKPVDIDIVIKRVEECNVIPDMRFYELRNSDTVVISKHLVKDKLCIGDKWEQYPYMTCVSKTYESHKWWQFWKWRKLVGYKMRYYKE